jgi:hypothetical protein
VKSLHCGLSRTGDAKIIYWIICSVGVKLCSQSQDNGVTSVDIPEIYNISMLAVLFVAEDPSKGYRLAYRYPPEAPTSADGGGHHVGGGNHMQSESMATLNELCKDSGGKTVAR